MKCISMLSERQKAYRKYLTTKEWKEKAEKFKAAWGNRCALCKSPVHLSVHHLNYDCLGKETISDVLPLCNSCHTRVHRKLTYIFLVNKEEMEAINKLAHVLVDNELHYYAIRRDKLKEMADLQRRMVENGK